MELGGLRHAPTTLPLGIVRYPLYRRMSGLQGRSLSGFDPLSVHSVASRGTNYATKPSNDYLYFDFRVLIAEVPDSLKKAEPIHMFSYDSPIQNMTLCRLYQISKVCHSF